MTYALKNIWSKELKIDGITKNLKNDNDKNSKNIYIFF